MGPTCLVGPAYFLSFLKLYLLNVSLQFYLFFQFLQKFFQIWIAKRISKKKNKNKLEKEKANLFHET